MALEIEQFKLLSCQSPAQISAASRKASDWFNRQGGAQAENGFTIAGPLKLGTACLKNLRVLPGMGAMMIQGEICNQALSEFEDALGAIGVRLTKPFEASMPGVLAGMRGNGHQYLITSGMIDLRSGQVVPTSTPYAFTCSVAMTGGGQ